MTAEVRALNTRFDSFGDLIDAKLAPIQRWMEGQPTVCADHGTRLAAVEAKVAEAAPAIAEHDKRLVRLEHVSANTILIGTGAWAIVMIILGALVNWKLRG